MAGSLERKLETILVVDDTPLLVNVVLNILTAAKFVVLAANSGLDALKLATDYTGTIDLLLSDVKMPGMCGPDLGAFLKKTRPDMHLMFMSGFTGGDFLVLNYGWSYIEKPFVAVKLVEMINSVLHTPDKSQGSRHYDTRKDSPAIPEGEDKVVFVSRAQHSQRSSALAKEIKAA
jgi:two-component system cell cycle sensor histidine kinase/response regulator CckA